MNVLYLLNQKTLSDFELPILQSKGLGIYIPKIYDSLDVSNSINMENHHRYDHTLTNISPEEMKVLDHFDFFNNNNYNDTIVKIIVKNFSIVILTLLTTTHVVNMIAQNLNGCIYYRFFGRENDLRYQPLLTDIQYPSKVKYIFSYEEIITFEQKFNQFFNEQNSYYVPLGVPDQIFDKYESTYHPQTNKFVFVCSKIGKCPYYTGIYETFNKNLGGFEFTILGKNNEKMVDTDHRIKNNLPDDQYYQQFSTHLAMYYHSTEERHLHYHPLEAIVIGLPIIFHDNSLLSSAYLSDSPGKCHSYTEVIEKLNRLQTGDLPLRDAIISYQNRIKIIHFNLK